MSLLFGGGKLRLAAALHAYVSRPFPRQVAPDRVNSALCKQPGIAAVEDVEVLGSAPGASVSAFVVLAADTPDTAAVVRSAAESLRRELHAKEVILSYIDESGNRRGILIVATA